MFFSAMIIFTFPTLAIISAGFDERQKEKFGVRRVLTIITISVIVTSGLILVLKLITVFHTVSQVLFLPLLSVIMIISSVVLYREFKGDIRLKISADNSSIPQVSDRDKVVKTPPGLFRSTLLFQSHYLEIISGKLDYVLQEADDIYARSLIQTAIRDFDPALIPALNAIAATDRFGESIRHEAAGAVYNIEKYFSDPLKNNDTIVQVGLAEKTATARSILISKRVPQVSEVLKLLRDSNPDVRRVGLAAIGRCGMRELLEEVIQALSVPETEKEAFYLLKHFGPDIYDEVIEFYLKRSGSEKMSMMIIRLLGQVSSPESISNLGLYIGQGPVGVRLQAVKYLRECGFKPSVSQQKKLTETGLELIENLARIIAFQLSTRKYKYFLLEKALGWERGMNSTLLYTILPFIIGADAAELLMKQMAGGSPYSTSLAAEVIETVAVEPMRGPLLALIDHKSDTDKLHELGYYYPLKETSDHSLAKLILSADQNIAGIWTKACTLRKVTEGKLQAEKELLISFLFSSRQILQEEGARAIRTLNPSWFNEVITRIPDPVRQRITAIIEQTQPEVAMIFDKTRFLNLCFDGIPEERMLSLASKMRYSESYDARPLPGLLTWIVPSENGKSGLYSLSISDITDFIFHYSEYTDIFVEYIDNPDRDSVSQIVNS